MSKLLSILLVEDNPADVALLRQVLGKAGLSYNMQVAEDGDEAINLLQDKLRSNHPILPDIMLLDLNLPKKSGHEVLEEMRKHPALSNIPVAILTSSDDPRDMARASLLKACCYVNKPPNLENLANMLDLCETAIFTIETASNARRLNLDQPHPLLKSASNQKTPFRILLVEDNQLSAKMISEILNSSAAVSFQIEFADSVASAATILTKQKPDCVLLDLGLPDSTGLDTLAKVQIFARDLPIVILTGMDDESTGFEAVKLGAQDYLIKSEVREDILVRAIRYAIDRKRAEKLATLTLATEQHILREVLENAPVSIVRIDRTNRITTFNSEFAKLVGVVREQINKRIIYELVPSLPFEAMEKIFNESQPFHQSRTAVQISSDKDDERYWDLVGWPIISADGKVREAIVLALDVTETVRLERERENIVAALAHDIRNPLVGEKRLLELLETGSLGQLTPTQSEIVTTMSRSNAALISMLNNLLDVYRYANSTMRPNFVTVNISQLLIDCLLDLKLLFKDASLDLSVHIAEDLRAIKGDAAAMRRLFTNLLHNALKFTPPGGHIHIQANNMADGIAVTIRDNGAGIPEEKRPFIFEKLWHGAASHDSFGLGLFVCKQIVEFHKGTIICDTQVGRGTEFRVELPLGDTAGPPAGAELGLVGKDS